MKFSYILALIVSSFILTTPSSADAARKDIQHKKQNAEDTVKAASKDCPCSRGPTGPRGHKGSRGPRGFMGATGPRGVTGATGPSTPVNAASFYISKGSTNSTVASGANFIFDTPAPPVIGTTGTAISYNAITGVFRISQTGVYQFNYGASSATTGGEPAASPTIALSIVNGSGVVAGSVVTLGETTIPANPSGELTGGSVILFLTAGQQVALINNSTFSITLSTPGLQPAIVAYIDIIEL